MAQDGRWAYLLVLERTDHRLFWLFGCPELPLSTQGRTLGMISKPELAAPVLPVQNAH